MIDAELGYAPIAQSFAAGYVGPGKYEAATHSFVAPESHPMVPIAELPGDYINPVAPTMDIPSFKSLSGIIVCCLMTAIVLSMFGCVARSDFTFPFLLFVYMVWCWESSWSLSKITKVPKKGGVDVEMKDVSEVYEHTSALVTASSRTIRNVQGATLLMIIVSCIDAVWIFAAYNAWTCDFDDAKTRIVNLDTQKEIQDPLACFNPDTQKPLMITYRLHRLVLWISNINFLLKITIIILSTLWANQQRKSKLLNPQNSSFVFDEPSSGSLLS